MYKTQGGDTALIRASANGHYEGVKLLLSAQASVNQRSWVRNCIHASCIFDLTLTILAFFSTSIEKLFSIAIMAIIYKLYCCFYCYN